MLTEIIIGFILVLLIYVFMIDKMPEGMPPGVWGWPIVGQMPSVNSFIYPNAQIYRQKYGKIFTWRIGTTVFVFLNDCKLVKEAYNNPIINARPEVSPISFMVELQKAGLTNNDGKALSDLRRFSLRYFKDRGMGKSSLEEFVTYEAECLVKDFRKYVNKPTEVPWSINVAVINILWKIVADKRYELENKEIQEFERLLTDIFRNVQSPRFYFYTFFPWLFRVIPNFVQRKIIFRDHFIKIKIFKTYFEKCIKDHQEAYDIDDQKDFIDAFLTEINNNEQGNGSEKTNTFTGKELIYTMFNFFAAGSETTSSTIRWIIFFMAKFGDIQKKLHLEIDNNVPRDRVPSLSDKTKLPYLEAIIHEVMRIKPLVPLGIFHKAFKDTTIGKYRIPKDTIVVSNIAECHFDLDYWENPTEFQPERFILPDGSFNNNTKSLIPFSVGMRECIGKAFAKMELYLFAGALLQNFSFKPADEVEFHFEPGPSGNLISIPTSMKVIISERP